MASFIQPVRPIDTAPPWDWNPGQTFVTAFNQTRLTKAKSEQLQMEAELEQILLPYKQKQAALALDKMQLDVELQSTRLDREREFTKQAYRQEIDRVKGVGGEQSGGGSRYGSGVADLVRTYQSGGRPAASGGSRKLGQGHTGD
jgi:hypothetical protein